MDGVDDDTQDFLFFAMFESPLSPSGLNQGAQLTCCLQMLSLGYQHQHSCEWNTNERQYRDVKSKVITPNRPLRPIGL
jgi:hypothetical protein